MAERYWGHRTRQPRAYAALPPVMPFDLGELDPDSRLWKERAWQYQGEFLKLLTDPDYRETWSFYLQPIPMSWKEIANTFEKAVKEYREGMDVDELAYRCGILPDECRCVLPEQHCRYCIAAAKVAVQPIERGD
jgi:hypothetical protein